MAVVYVLFIYAVASVAAFIAYGLDKRAAARGRWRVPEASLHLIELLGGFTGALLGQHAFRHKRRKARYMIIFWLIVALHAVGWLLWALS
jgi:uncharacterized membrane protein YsdA (DUF1294 family)